MNFSTFEKVSSGNLIYFKNAVPIENAGSLKFYKDNATGAFLKKEMRWSFDRVHWASWEDLNIGNISKINTGDNKYLFFEIKYTMTSPTAGKVSSFSIEYLPATGKTYAPPVEDVNMDHDHTLPDGCNALGGTTKTFEVIKITNAETLCGKSCDYYLWRYNHKGQQPISSITDLQAVLDNLQEEIYALDPSTTLNSAYNLPGDAGVFAHKDVSARALVFKGLIEGNLITISDDPSTITIGVSTDVNNKFSQIDNSLNYLYQANLIQDGSILYLKNWNISQDSPGDYVRKDGDTMSGDLAINANFSISGDASLNGLVISDKNITEVNYIDFLLDPSVPAHKEGRVHWNSDDRTIEVGAYVNGDDVTLQLGQEEYILGRNVTGYDISNGTPVFISGYSGGRPSISPAIAGPIECVSCNVIGLATHNIPNNQIGFVTISGIVRDLNTSDFNEGDEVWLSSNNYGEILPTRPSKPFTQILIGYILQADAVDGKIAVNIDRELFLTNLSDVRSFGTQQAGDIIIRNAANDAWEVKAGVDKVYIDGSLASRDSSISFLFDNYTSRIYVDGSLLQRDVSIAFLESSVNYLYQQNYPSKA